MPRTVEQGFEAFLAKLKATTPETQLAKNHRASIEACLKGNFGLQRFARIGSFGNGTSVSGFLCEAHALKGAEDITKFGGWRAFLAGRSAS